MVLENIGTKGAELSKSIPAGTPAKGMTPIVAIPSSPQSLKDKVQQLPTFIQTTRRDRDSLKARLKEFTDEGDRKGAQDLSQQIGETEW